ncbi:MAG: XdhC family protein [Propionibacteriaceae bacterium]
MRDVLPDLLGWWRAGEPAAVATVIRTWRSAPRQPGATMAVGPGHAVLGSVSGGCVEADVYALATQVLADGRPVRQRYGISDDDAFAVGLTCGGTLDVFVERVSPADGPDLDTLAAQVDAHEPIALATVVAHPDPGRVGRRLLVHPAAGVDPGGRGLGSDRVDAAVSDDARGMLASGTDGLLAYGPDGQRRGSEIEVFVTSWAPRPRMLVFGAIDFAAAVAKLGGFLGYRVTVCDPRPVFATPARFPGVDEVVVDRPDRYLAAEADAGRLDPRTAVCVLTHNPRFDVPLLEIALRLDLGYVGAMGSQRTHDQRLSGLRSAGTSETRLARLSSPIGLDLGARTPEETAISIAAEIVALRWGGDGGRLRDRDGPIHHPIPPDRSPSGSSSPGLAAGALLPVTESMEHNVPWT